MRLEQISWGHDGLALGSELSLSLRAGEWLVVSGPSGRGKSSLLQLLMGFLPPLSGRVALFGELLDGDSAERLRRHMGWLPQGLSLAPGVVRESLLWPFEFRNNRHLRPDESALGVELEALRLPPSLLDREVEQLSGGERQRLLLVSLLLLRRRLLLLDEPSSALDSESRNLLMERLRRERGLALVVVSHDPHWLESADRRLEL